MSEHFKTVQWDIRFYFARHGGEGIKYMTKVTFTLKKDPETGFSYVTKVIDEETKNYKETDQDVVTGFMPEIPDCEMCPVQSFL